MQHNVKASLLQLGSLNFADLHDLRFPAKQLNLNSEFIFINLPDGTVNYKEIERPFKLVGCQIKEICRMKQYLQFQLWYGGDCVPNSDQQNNSSQILLEQRRNMEQASFLENLSPFARDVRGAQFWKAMTSQNFQCIRQLISLSRLFL